MSFAKKFCSKSPFKGIIRGLGPHNPGHKAAGDDSDAAHGTDAFKGAQAEWDKKQKASDEKEASNPNAAKIKALSKKMSSISPFDEGGEEERNKIYAQIKALRAQK